MTRLTHSSGGFIRYLQMSSARLFAFVEGRLDRAFFDRIFAKIFQPSSTPYQIIAMKEVPGSAGGKTALLSTFKSFRSKGLLASAAFGKPMVCVFLADKDSDDFCRRQLRSPHLIYTPTYDLEAHLFSCGDLHRALADSCGITIQQAQTLIPDPDTWLINTVHLWKEWIALCLVSQHQRANCGCTFNRNSQVNPDPLAAPEPARVEAFKANLAVTLGMDISQLDGLYLQAFRRVEASLRAGTPMRYFKGKWLNHIIQRFLETQPRIPDANINGVGERLGVSLVAQVAAHANCTCCDPYMIPLTDITKSL